MFLSGIDIGGTSIKFGIFDEQLNLLQQWSRPTPKEPAEAAALIAAQLEPYHVAAIGAGAPGTLNAARETITADNLAWVDSARTGAHLYYGAFDGRIRCYEMRFYCAAAVRRVRRFFLGGGNSGRTAPTLPLA